MPSATIDPSANGTSQPTAPAPDTTARAHSGSASRSPPHPATPSPTHLSLAPAFAAALFEAKAFALATLSDIMRDPQAPPKERRLAATAILRFAASSERPPRARAGDPDHPGDADSDGGRGARADPSRPPPGFTPNADVLAKSRLAYDHGYWTAFCNAKHSHDNLDGPAAPAPGRESVTLSTTCPRFDPPTSRDPAMSLAASASG